MPTWTFSFPDPGGLYFYLAADVMFSRVDRYQRSEEAWQSCTPGGVNPLQPLMTARFMTHTTVMFEHATSTPAPVGTPNSPGPSSTKIPQQTQSIPSVPTETKGQADLPGGAPDSANPTQNVRNSKNNDHQHAPTMPGNSNNNGDQHASVIPINNDHQHAPNTPAIQQNAPATQANEPRPIVIPSTITGTRGDNIVLNSDRAGVILPNGATLFHGSQTTIDGTTFSLAPSGTAIIVDGSTIPIPTGFTFSAISVGDKNLAISLINISAEPARFAVLTINGVEVTITAVTDVSGGGVVQWP
ncbi:hypothetical protein DM02DRAFT_674942 [Periconia macrospinosa]|uniref:Uncharacterized protein n=1 Tax=Periconia macrospinosa TaxID=97972 RepID=A0A2V1DGG0_9PLEO|nr:hypothetical protein DM02DRAFT_674942 [Periconia macrospinosa]